MRQLLKFNSSASVVKELVPSKGPKIFVRIAVKVSGTPNLNDFSWFYGSTPSLIPLVLNTSRG